MNETRSAYGLDTQAKQMEEQRYHASQANGAYPSPPVNKPGPIRMEVQEAYRLAEQLEGAVNDLEAMLASTGVLAVEPEGGNRLPSGIETVDGGISCEMHGSLREVKYSINRTGMSVMRIKRRLAL